MQAFRATTWGWWILAVVVLFWFASEDTIRKPLEWIAGNPFLLLVAILLICFVVLAPLADVTVTGGTRGEPQPAFKLFAMDRGWRILDHLWSGNREKIEENAYWWWDKSDDYETIAESSTNKASKYFWYSITFGFRFGGFLQYVPSYLIISLVAGIYGLIVGVMFLATYVAILFCGVTHTLYRWRYRSRVSCPHCHHESDFPMYLCPNLKCRAKHTRLWPSEYGVFHHDCTCGIETLPTLKRLGKNKLDKRCPNCEQPLAADVGELTDIHIPVVGGVSAGKSTLMVMATRELLSKAHPEYSAAAQISDESQRTMFNQQLDDLNHGTKIARTQQTLPQAFNITVKSEKKRVGSIVYFYDAAGESWEKRDLATQQSYFDRANGVMLVIDPLAMSRLNILGGTNLGQIRTASGASRSDIEEVYLKVEEQLRRHAGFSSRGGKHTLPLAVIVTKVDEMGLEDVIGIPAAEKLRQKRPDIQTADDAIHELVRQFLVNYGLQPVITHIDAHFGNVRYFSVSSLGRQPDGTGRAFEPIRAEKPLFWLLEQNGVLPRKD